MKGILFSTILLAGLSVSSFGATTMSDGSFEDPGIWDCACVPDFDDDVFIKHVVSASSAHTIQSLRISSGGHLTSTTLTILETVKIESGAEMENNGLMTIKSHYVLNGIHSGAATTKFIGNSNLSGSGVYSNSKMPEFLGKHTIQASADLNFTTSTVRIKNSAVINNYGVVTLKFLWGGGLEQWHNRTGSTLKVLNYIKSGMKFYAHYTNNSVQYLKSGSSYQDIKVPVNGYYNLLLSGTSLASVKFPVNDFLVLNDFTIVNCTFDLKRATVISDVTLNGNWINTSGQFIARTGKVTFGGTSTVQSHESLEEFYQLEFSGNTQLMTDIAVESEVFISNTLDANGHDIHVEGDWLCVGDYIGNTGSVIFEGTSASIVSGATDFDDVSINKTSGGVTVTGPMKIYETLWMDNGVLNTNNNVYIASNSSRTGRLGEMGAATFNGDLWVERYMNEPLNGWHLLGAGVDNMTIAQWNNDFITTGFIGANWPNYGFCSMTRYDETVLGDKDSGMYNISSTADPVPTGEGIRAYIAAGVTKLRIKGPAVTGPFNWSISYSDSGSPEDDGWNLISNPYASTIDWDDTGNWTKSGVKDAIYVWVSEDEQFSSYIAGVGTNGGTQYIPSSQAFWVQTEASGPLLGIVEAAKVDEDVAFRSIDDLSFFKLKVTTSNGRTDEAAIRLDDNATFAFDGDFDAYEWRSSNAAYPSIGLMTEEGKSASIYSFPTLETVTEIPISLYVGSDGEVEFSTEGLQSFTEAQNVRIFDALNDEYLPLGDGNQSTIELESGEYNGRFYLVLNPRTTFNEDRAIIANSDEYKIWSDENFYFVRTLAEEVGLINIDVFNGIGQRIDSRSNISIHGTNKFEIPRTNGQVIIEILDLESGERITHRLVR